MKEDLYKMIVAEVMSSAENLNQCSEEQLRGQLKEAFKICLLSAEVAEEVWEDYNQ